MTATPTASSPRLSGKVVLVAGAASGIGAAIARRCAVEAARVVCADLDEPAARTLAAGIGNDAAGWHCDVTSTTSAQDLVRNIRDRFGRLDGFVYNVAAPSHDGTVVEFDEARFRYELDCGLTGAFIVSKHAIPLMAASGGSIVFIASQFAHVAVGRSPVYCAMKAGLVHLAKAMAIDHAPDNIRVNSLSPGAIATNRLLARHADLDAANAALGPAHLTGRIGQPAEVAAAAAFLLSDDASFVTGTDLLVDGGYATR
ncbi:MAG: SDR family oxidoreductase [Rhizobiaceae bacterium]|nr:SDR family oxidoreductase [Rhizobiaceae bacterium]